MRTGKVGPAELAPLIKFSRQAIRMWAVQAGVDLNQVRERWARKCWQEANK
jgi:hypothetical protein